MSRTSRVPSALKDRWASIREAMELLAVSRTTIGNLITEGKLETMKYFGDRTFVSRDSIDDVLSQFVTR